jgi:hypothetical protein
LVVEQQQKNCVTVAGAAIFSGLGIKKKNRNPGCNDFLIFKKF